MHFKVHRHSLTESKRQRKTMISVWKMSTLNCVIASYCCLPLQMFDSIFIIRPIIFSGFQTKKKRQNFEVSRFFVIQAIKVPHRLKTKWHQKGWTPWQNPVHSYNLCTKPNSALLLTKAGRVLLVLKTACPAWSLWLLCKNRLKK